MVQEARALNKPVSEETWAYICQLLLGLGPEGMSSDESDDEHKFFRCREMEWRRKIDNILELVDHLAGSYPGSRHRRPRIRNSGLKTNREAPHQFEKSLLDPDWLSSISPATRALYNPKNNGFEWKQTYEDHAAEMGNLELGRSGNKI
jgi:hypothetical protein